MVVDCFSRDPGIRLAATVRSKPLLDRCAACLPHVDWRTFNADDLRSIENLDVLAGCEYAINAIGITKPLIHDNNPAECDRAIRVNSLLPHALARNAEANGTTVLQIATDCVYSGAKGRYVECDDHDALDVYGKTKSLGEVPSDRFCHLRSSIIGPEPKEDKFLLAWFLNQQHGAVVKGYANHLWNGITTLHFARICLGLIKSGFKPPVLQHVVPTGDISKYDLLECFAKEYRRTDVEIGSVEVPVTVDRTLATQNETANVELWQAAGYDRPLTVPEMVEELARWQPQLAGIAADTS